MKATRVAQNPESPWTGRGIRIAMLDTGVDANHPDLGPRVAAARSFVAGCSPHDSVGHGTHCAGIAVGFRTPGNKRYGIAHHAELYVARVLDDTGRGEAAAVIAGLEWAVACGCQIIAITLGARDRPPSPDFDDAGRRALDADCLVIAAAGNGGEEVVQPANAASIMAIGAVDNWLKPAAFSPAVVGADGGGAVDLVAPGVNIYSTDRCRGYAAQDGTSMATAHVAGIAALWAEAEGLRGWALWQRLLERAEPLPWPSNAPVARMVTAP